MVPLAQKLALLPQNPAPAVAPPANVWRLRTDPAQERLTREYERGKLEAENAAAQRIGELKETHARELQDALANARVQWSREEGEKLAQELQRSVAALQSRLEDSIARILQPFLAEKLRAKAMLEFNAALKTLLDHDEAASINISGPADLLGRLGEAKQAQGCTVHVKDGAICEATARSDATHIETHLRSWLDAIGAGEA